MNDGLIGGFVGWIKHPFDSRGSALNWIGFVGLLVIAAWMWNTVLLAIKTE